MNIMISVDFSDKECNIIERGLKEVILVIDELVNGYNYESLLGKKYLDHIIGKIKKVIV